MNGKGLIGLSGDMYGHLGELAFVCAGCCLCLAVKQSCFFVEFVFSCVLVLKGTWVLQVGLLYTDVFALEGCENLLVGLANGKNDVKCDLEENKLRGTALMDLLFIVHIVVVMIMSLGLFALLNRNKRMRCGDTSGPLLAQVGSEEKHLEETTEVVSLSLLFIILFKMLNDQMTMSENKHAVCGSEDQ
ncbi:hypothetical protein K7X08_010781 [Anisodus acutangulus]|uniref:Uncharacterized protein n=1 Tax=Anisodus acutangulus TaxID=402998 RepID=A0A9Q1LXI4_9SOLA|nr:hypothetical protein K7X08_010781 [Anisodus acutangulus]